MGSEVRQFVHSGLFSELTKSGWKITVMSKIVDEDIREQLPAEIELIQLPAYPHSVFAETFTKIIDNAFIRIRRQRGESVWQFGRVNNKNWREGLLSHFINVTGWMLSGFPGLLSKTFSLENKLYRNSDRSIWKELLTQQNIDAILVNVPRQTVWNPVFTTAQEIGVKTFLIYHTSKDITANPRLNHTFTGIGVWNTEMKQNLLRQNPWIDPTSVQVVGCGHFDCVGRQDWLPPETVFRQQIGALPNSQLILYPTAGPGIVPHEERYIENVVQAVRNLASAIGKNIQIVFRLNPMDNLDLLFNYIKQNYPEHITLRPDWKDIRKSNWTYARKSDPVLYNALLRYSSVCVTIPSTVTVDCAIADLPAINLGIEVQGEQPLAGSLRAFWEVDFNRNVRETGAAKFVTTQFDLEFCLKEFLSEKSIDSKKREALIRYEVDGIKPGQSSRQSASLISFES
jgi:hypothetical protein